MNQGEIRIFTLQLGCLLEFDYVIIEKMADTQGSPHKLT